MAILRLVQSLNSLDIQRKSYKEQFKDYAKMEQLILVKEAGNQLLLRKCWTIVNIYFE